MNARTIASARKRLDKMPRYYGAEGFRLAEPRAAALDTVAGVAMGSMSMDEAMEQYEAAEDSTDSYYRAEFMAAFDAAIALVSGTAK